MWKNMFPLILVVLLAGAEAVLAYEEPLAKLSKFVPVDPSGEIPLVVDGFGWYAPDMNIYLADFNTTPPYSAEIMFSFYDYEFRKDQTGDGWVTFDSWFGSNGMYKGQVPQMTLQFDNDVYEPEPGKEGRYHEQIHLGWHDGLLEEFGDKFIEINVPLYLRLGGEVNGDWQDYDEYNFIKSFRYMVDFWDNMGVTNVAYIWNVHIMDDTFQYLAWYPGDNYVHWWSHEILGPNDFPNWMFASPAVLRSKEFCADAVSRGLPVAVPEASAWITGVGYQALEWNLWFNGFFNHINDPSCGVRAYWHLPLGWKDMQYHAPQLDGDFPLNARPTDNELDVAPNWQNEMNKPQYVHGKVNPSDPLDLEVIGWPIINPPPDNVTNLFTGVGQGQVVLSWTNPTNDDLKGIKILRRTDGYPLGPRDTDATQVHNGPPRVRSITDMGLQSGITYYYGIFPYDPVRNYATGVFTAATPQ